MATIPLKHWSPRDRITAADLNRLTEAVKRATPIAGPGISTAQSLAGTIISVTKKTAVTNVAGMDDFPFKIMRVNSGTESSPEWHTLVYIPDYAIYCRFPIYSDMEQYDSENLPYWYEFTDGNAMGTVCLEVKVIRHSAWEENPVRCYYRLNGLSEDVDWPVTETQENFRTSIIPLGVVSGSGGGDVYNLVRSGLYVNADFIYDTSGGGGGGDGYFVLIDDQRGSTESSGIVGFGGINTTTGTATLIVKDGVDISAVYFDTSGTTLIDYLAGNVESMEEPYSDLGKNLNTVNFEEEMLGDTITPDEIPDPNKAAPSCHKHTLDQIVSADGETLTQEDVIGFFSNVGMWEPIGEGAEGTEPSDDSLLTVGDIEDNPLYFKPDSETPSAGSVLTGMLALSDHRHPLNVADKLAGTTAQDGTYTPPSADAFIKAVGVGVNGEGEKTPSAAEFGESQYYARTDHVHPICAEMGDTGGIDISTTPDSADIYPEDGDIAFDTTEWTPGTDGITESYISRIVKVSLGQVTVRYAVFRKRKISRTGVVLWIGPEYFARAL